MGQPIPRLRTKYTTQDKLVVPAGSWYRKEPGGWKLTQTLNVTLDSKYSSFMVCKDQKNPGPPYIKGGPFTSIQSKIQPFPVMGHGTYHSKFAENFGDGTFFRRYSGGFTNPSFGGFDFTISQLQNPAFYLGGDIVLPVDPFYPLVDNALRPRLSKADGAVFLIELKDMPRMLLKTASDFKSIYVGLVRNKKIDLSDPHMPKEIADSFLNHQFGWAPFVRDMEKLVDAFQQSSEFILDITRRNNRWDHRSRVLQEDEIDGETVLSKSASWKVQPNNSPQMMSVVDTTSADPFSAEYLIQDVVRVWATGDYRFYRPEFDSTREDFVGLISQIKRRLVLYGLEINPYVLWKVTPWSWLVDWFSNVGPFIASYVSASSDQVISKNLYLMHRRRRRIVLRQNIRFWDGLRSFDFPREIVVKQRAVAETPFGFGPTWNALTPRQWAILASLAVSRRKWDAGSV